MQRSDKCWHFDGWPLQNSVRPQSVLHNKESRLFLPCGRGNSKYNSNRQNINVLILISVNYRFSGPQPEVQCAVAH